MDTRKLISEIFQPQFVQLIIEGKTVDGRVILRGKLQAADTKNGNGRVYPRNILESKTNNYINKFVKNRTSMGELDHPESQIVNLANASHLITEIWWEGDAVMGKIELLNTPTGKIAQAIVEAQIPLGISSRGVGSVKQIGETVEVQDDLEFIAWDLVSNPSTPESYMYLKEGQTAPILNKYSRTNQIITEILCSRGFCSCEIK